jgi:uncharacterized protein (DUF2252 family)
VTSVPQTSSDRTDLIVDVFTEAFGELAEADPTAVRRKFRKMAAEPAAFYRGSAPLFYADAAQREDPWADERTSRVWIQGDLHVENFGTYMDGEGHLVFDVNDFDEAYLGHFTWDLQRLVASVAMMGWTKALSDEEITGGIQTCLRAYLDQVHEFVDSDHDHTWSLRLDNSSGLVQDALKTAQLSTRIALLDTTTVVDDYERRFRSGSGVRRLEDAERGRVEEAFAEYLTTIPESKRLGSLTYALKDLVGVTGFGIGSAGLPAYNLLVEGHTEALENDVVLSMKQGNVAAVSRVVDDQECGSSVTEADEIGDVLEQLGRATAKVHCVSDVDDDSTPLVPFQVEDAIVAVVGGREDELVEQLTEFAHDYAAQARQDHSLFVDAFRAGRTAFANVRG